MDPQAISQRRRPPKRESKKSRLIAWLEQNRPESIGEPEWDALLGMLAPISESYLRRLLRDWAGESGVPMTPMVEGVRQESFDALESSLLKLYAEYEFANAARRSRIRRLVIEAKDHARLAARNEERRGEKEEMALWMVTWLENPSVFPEWIRLRRAVIGPG